jgi:hypothetical protein
MAKQSIKFYGKKTLQVLLSLISKSNTLHSDYNLKKKHDTDMKTDTMTNGAI